MRRQDLARNSFALGDLSSRLSGVARLLPGSGIVGPPSRQGSLRRHADEQCDRALAGLEPHTLIERGGSAIIAPDGPISPDLSSTRKRSYTPRSICRRLTRIDDDGCERPLFAARCLSDEGYGV